MGQRAEDLLTFHFGPMGSGMFGSGATAIEALEAGMLGDGNSVHTSRGPDEGAMVKSGHVSRVLRRCSPIVYQVLAMAYGDAGYAATERNTAPSRRWVVVAPLTDEARRRAEAWRAAGHGPDHGHPAAHWWHSAEAKRDDLAQRAVKRAAEALLAHAMGEFTAALAALEADQRAIRQTGQRRRVPAAVALAAAA